MEKGRALRWIGPSPRRVIRDRMKPRQIPWKWLLVGLGSVLLVALALLPGLLGDSPQLAKRVTDALSDWSGGEVKLTGPLHVRYFPDVSIRSGIEITNASRLPLVKWIKTSDVRLSLDLADLVLGRVSVDAMRLYQPEITLKDVPTLITGPDQTLSARVANLLGGAPIGVVRVRDGTVLLPSGEAIKKIDARFDASSGRGAMSSFGSFALRDETLRFALDCSAGIGSGSDLRVPFVLTLASRPVTAKVTGNASFVNGLQLDGGLQADMTSARKFLRWSGIGLPPGPSLQRLSASGVAHWNGRTLTFDDGSYTLDGNSAVGALALTPGTRPRVDGTLAFERLALDPYLQGADPADPALMPENLRDQALLNYFDADLRISAAEITAPDMKLGRGGFTISAMGGALTSEIGELEFCGGQAVGRLNLDLSKEVPVGALAVSLSDVPIEDCLRPYAPDLALSGVGGLKSELTAEGRTYHELVSGLAGTVKIDAEDGSVPVDLNPMFAASNQLDIKGWSRDNATLFDHLNADCRLGADHIWCETFNMQTQRGVISGSGEVDLGQQKLDWSLFVANHAQPLQASRLSAETPPRISISGSLSQPVIRRANRPTLGEGSMRTNSADSQVAPR
jgi:AsmA protein